MEYRKYGTTAKLFERFERVNKVRLDEGVFDTETLDSKLIEYYNLLKENQLNIKTVNTSVSGDESFVELVCTDEVGNEITFNFKSRFDEGDQDGVFNLVEGELFGFSFNSKDGTTTIDIDENGLRTFNERFGNEIISVISDFVDVESNQPEEALYTEAVKKIEENFGRSKIDYDGAQLAFDKLPQDDKQHYLRVAHKAFMQYLAAMGVDARMMPQREIDDAVNKIAREYFTNKAEKLNEREFGHDGASLSHRDMKFIGKEGASLSFETLPPEVKERYRKKAEDELREYLANRRVNLDTYPKDDFDDAVDKMSKRLYFNHLDMMNEDYPDPIVKSFATNKSDPFKEKRSSRKTKIINELNTDTVQGYSNIRLPQDNIEEGRMEQSVHQYRMQVYDAIDDKDLMDDEDFEDFVYRCYVDNRIRVEDCVKWANDGNWRGRFERQKERSLTTEDYEAEKQRFGHYGAELVDDREMDDYVIFLLRSTYGDMYQVGMMKKDNRVIDPESQEKLRYSAGGREFRIARFFYETVKEWLDEYGTLMVGSHNRDKLRSYHNILTKLGLNASEFHTIHGQQIFYLTPEGEQVEDNVEDDLVFEYDAMNVGDDDMEEKLLGYQPIREQSEGNDMVLDRTVIVDVILGISENNPEFQRALFQQLGNVDTHASLDDVRAQISELSDSELEILLIDFANKYSGGLNEGVNKEHCVIWDGTSAYIAPSIDAEEEKAAGNEVMDYFDDIDAAQAYADEVNQEAYR